MLPVTLVIMETLIPMANLQKDQKDQCRHKDHRLLQNNFFHYNGLMLFRRKNYSVF